MSSVVDSSTALEVMKSANDDFVELLLKLKSLLNGKNPVTFTMGKYTITVNTILELINNYKNGKFEEVILGGQPSGPQVKLSVDSDGNLCVTDVDGNVVSISCKKLISSVLENCIANQVTATSAKINSVQGTVSVIGGNVSFDSMRFNRLAIDRLLKARVIEASQLVVSDDLRCNEIMVLGVRKFVPKYVRSLFYRNGTAMVNAASFLQYDTDGSWKMNAGGDSLTPADIGFRKVDSMDGLVAATVVPDMIRFMGDTDYLDFVTRRTRMFSSVAEESTVPPNVAVYAASPNSSSYVPIAFDGSKYLFAAILAFPTGGYVPSQTANGTLYLTSFAPSDIGKEIYYQTYNKKWKIYRTMKLIYDSASATTPISVEFGQLTNLPEYTCSKFIVNYVTEVTSSGKSVTYTLEFA